MKLYSALYCLWATTFFSVQALAECALPPDVPVVACVGANGLATQTEREAAKEAAKYWQPLYEDYNRCLYWEYKSAMAALSAANGPAAQLLYQDYAKKSASYAEQVREGVMALSSIGGGLCSTPSRATASLAPAVQPQNQSAPRRESPQQAPASQVSGAAAASGNTFKSACWNHNLNAAELLDCGACEKQYADMLPQLNQLAANKKQTQLNAFLGDCPRVGK
jgi:hypothetical protein